MLSSCRGAKIANVSEHVERNTQTKIQIQKQIDSVLVYQRDSIYIRERSDTVFIEKWHTKISYRDRVRSDTVRLSDTIRVLETVKETVEVEVNRVTGWQWFQIYAGRILAGLLLLFVGFKLIKK
jgi:hypothetical protein